MDISIKHGGPPSPQGLAVATHSIEVRIRVVEADGDDAHEVAATTRDGAAAARQAPGAAPRGRAASPARIRLPLPPDPVAAEPFCFPIAHRVAPAPPAAAGTPARPALRFRAWPAPIRWRRDDVPPPPSSRAASFIADLDQDTHEAMISVAEVREMTYGLMLLRDEIESDRPHVSGPQDETLMGNLTAMHTMRVLEENHISELLLTCGEMAGVAWATLQQLTPYGNDVPQAMLSLGRAFIGLARDLGHLRNAVELRQSSLGTMRPNPARMLGDSPERRITWCQNPLFPNAPLRWCRPEHAVAIANHFGDQASALDEMRTRIEAMRLVLEHVAQAIRVAYPRPAPVWPVPLLPRSEP